MAVKYYAHLCIGLKTPLTSRPSKLHTEADYVKLYSHVEGTDMQVKTILLVNFSNLFNLPLQINILGNQ